MVEEDGQDGIDMMTNQQQRKRSKGMLRSFYINL